MFWQLTLITSTLATLLVKASISSSKYRLKASLELEKTAINNMSGICFNTPMSSFLLLTPNWDS